MCYFTITKWESFNKIEGRGQGAGVIVAVAVHVLRFK